MEFWDYVFKPAHEKLQENIIHEKMKYDLENAIKQNSNLLDFIANKRISNQDQLILPTPAISESGDSKLGSIVLANGHPNQHVDQQRAINQMMMNSHFYPL